MDLTQLAAKAYDHQNRLDTLAQAQPAAAWKTALTGRTSATRATDPDLAVPLAANTIYEIRAFLMYWSAIAGAGFNFGWNPPGGGGAVGGSWGGTYNITGTGMGNYGNTWSTVVGLGTPAAQNNGVVLAGTLITVGSAGIMNLAWGTVDGVHTVNLNAGSYLIAIRIGP